MQNVNFFETVSLKGSRIGPELEYRVSPRLTQTNIEMTLEASGFFPFFFTFFKI